MATTKTDLVSVQDNSRDDKVYHRLFAVHTVHVFLKQQLQSAIPKILLVIPIFINFKKLSQKSHFENNTS